jgi:hypothetical protein
MLLSDVMDHFNFHVTLIQALDTSNCRVASKTITSVRIELGQGCPHLVRFISSAERNLKVRVVVVGSLIAFLQRFLLAPFEDSVRCEGGVLNHAFSIRVFGGQG